MRVQLPALLVLTAASLGGCATESRQAARPGTAEPGGGARGGSTPGKHAALPPKECGSRAAFPSQHAISWVEDPQQKLCCSPRREGGTFRFVAAESCVSRYAPWLRLPDLIEPSAATAGPQPSAAVCSPGVEAKVQIPTPELEARLDSGALLRVDSCVGESCSAAVVAFDNLSREDQLLFALEGTPASGASLVWRAGAVQLSVRVVQSREQLAPGERYRLVLTLGDQPLRAIETTLTYSATGPGGCPLAHVTVGDGEPLR